MKPQSNPTKWILKFHLKKQLILEFSFIIILLIIKKFGK